MRPLTARTRFALMAIAAVMIIVAACDDDSGEFGPLSDAQGDPEAGKAAIEAFGCGTCHTIPGISTADGRVGPPLDAFGQRLYIAGAIENNVKNLTQWIQAPESIEPGTLMPNLAVPEESARSIVAYLATLD